MSPDLFGPLLGQPVPYSAAFAASASAPCLRIVRLLLCLNRDVIDGLPVTLQSGNDPLRRLKRQLSGLDGQG